MSPRQQQLLAGTSPTGFQLIEWRTLPNSTTALRGHATVEMPSGLVISDIPVFLKDGNTISVGVPSKPLVDAGGTQLRDQDNKRRYAPTISFATPAARSRWMAAIRAALEAAGIETA